MTWHGRVAAFTVVVLIVVAMTEAFPPALDLAVLAVSVAAAWRHTTGFWRTVLSGLAGGVLAGVLILGPGFRLAMRAVAIMDPVQDPEFTVEGTLFIVIFVGAVFGGILAMIGNLIRKAAGIHSEVLAGLATAALVMIGLTFFSGEVSDELFRLGISPWINIPLFGVFAGAYGIASMALAGVSESRVPNRASLEPEEVLA
jgi:hypothetical protein